MAKFRGYMESSDDIVDRIEQLEGTLEWKEVEPSVRWALVSIQSNRLVATLVCREDGFFRTADYDYGRENQGYVFTTLEGAKGYSKFSAIRSILEHDLRRSTVQ
jgi:hypothetical protein